MAVASSEGCLSPEQQRMLEFAVLWLDFGGGRSEDIFVKFGVSDRVFFGRLEVLVSQYPVPVTDSVKRRLIELCRIRSRAPLSN